MYKFNNDEKKILEQVDIVDFISKYVDLKKAGSNFKGYSPFKDENTPSFIVSPTKKIFTCFSTGVSGDLIHFYKTIKNISRNQAVNEIAKEYGILLSNKYKESSIYSKILEDATNFFVNNLSKSKEAIEYLKNRNQDYNNLKKYNIGYANSEWNSLSKYLFEKYSKDKLLELGLVFESEKTSNLIDMFRNRIMFPIYNIDLEVVGFGGRYIGDDKNQPKYLNSIESKIFDKSKELYGIFDRGLSIKNNKYAILVEGFLDVISLHNNGFESSVASLGTAFTESHAKLLSKLTNSVILIFDNDEAGIKATRNTINILNKYEFNIKCLSLPDGIKDPDEYFLKNTQEDFLKLLKNESVDAFEYIYNFETKGINLSLATSKREILKRLKPYFLSIKNEIVYTSNVSKLSNLLSIDKSIINEEYIRNLKSQNRSNKKDVFIKPIDFLKKQEALEYITLKYLIVDKSIEINTYNLLTNLEFLSEKYSELNKKLKSIRYRVTDLELEYTEKEHEIVADLVLSEPEEINDFTYTSLIKDWLVDVYIKREEEKINEIVGKEKLVFKNEISILKDKVKKSNNILELEELFKKIKILEGVKYGQ